MIRETRYTLSKSCCSGSSYKTDLGKSSFLGKFHHLLNLNKLFLIAICIGDFSPNKFFEQSIL